MITANYLYACQGDRILSRELLINNRLLYMDSKWLGGTFTISTGGMAGIMFRGTANQAQNTSDKYLDSDALGEGQEKATYPVPYFDATPEYYVTPYLNFYITTFVDENVSQVPEAYNAEKYPDGIPTIVSDSVKQSYKSGSVDQQLNYFAGSSYISSLGDLSTKYVNQVKIPNTPRLLDITLGSDVPGYFNNIKPDPFELYTEADDEGKPLDGAEKSLLNKIILTNLTNLDYGLNVRSPDKLTEFRALGTLLKYALFAKGAPLRAVHLPNTVTKLEFIQNKNLTKILTETPVVLDMVEGVKVPRSIEEYSGLFVDGITNYNPSDETMYGDSNIAELDFEGDALGYGSYVILENTVKRREGTNTRLSIRMADIHWTPYTQVEYGEKKLSNTDYYYLTDHSTYINYEETGRSGDAAWVEDTLNGRIYTYDPDAGKEIDAEKGEQIISDLSLLDKFELDYRTASGINQFTNNMETMLGVKSYPTISGELYVANTADTAINELTLTNKYNACWPDLIIRAAYVNPAPAIKYIEIDASTGKEKQLDIKYSENDKIVLTDKALPTRVHYDFLGWSPDKPGTTDTPTYYVVWQDGAWSLTAAGETATIDSNTNTMTLYAIFAPHAYPAVFDFNNGTTPQTITTTWEAGKLGLNTPKEVPSKPYQYEDDAVVDGGLALYRTYAFKGWAFAGDEDETIQNLAILPPDHNYNFIAIYEDKSVYDNIVDYDTYLTAELNSTQDGCIISLNTEYELSGKVTLPTVIDGLPVTGIRYFSGNRHKITHIFWAQENRHVTTIMSRCFENSTTLLYVEPLDSYEEMQLSAFSGCTSLRLDNLTELLETASTLQSTVFAEVGRNTVHIPGHAFDYIGQRALASWGMASKLVLGSEDDPCQWISMLDENKFANNAMVFEGFGGLAGVSGVQIYIPSSQNSQDNRHRLLAMLGLENQENAMEENIVANVTNPPDYAWIIVEVE